MDVAVAEKRTFHVSTSEIVAMDRWIEAVGDLWGTSERIVFSARLCVAELAANTLEHGGTARGDDQITVTIHRACDGLEIEFLDSRTAFDPTCEDAGHSANNCDDVRPGGRGLKLLRAYADELSYRGNESCNRVRVKICQ